MAAVNKLVIEQGATWQYAWPITDANGNNISLAGYTAKAQIRTSLASTPGNTLLYEWSSALGTILLTDSKVTLLLEPAVSSAWTWLVAVYDIEITSGSGEVSRISEGLAVLNGQVTT